MASDTPEPAALFPRPPISPEDLAFGVPYGPASPWIDRFAARRCAAKRVSRPDTSQPLAVLEAVVAESLDRGPCFVSFSGGTDSSLILSVATRTARALGRPDPVPLTWRFDSGAPLAREDDWQEAVVAELGLADWQRLDAGDRLDWLGPVAVPVLRDHGVLYPANAFLHAPLAEIAAGGTLLTGIGGDQVLGSWRHHDLAALLARRRPPRRSDPRALARRSLPRPVRSRLDRRRTAGDSLAWLTPTAQRRQRNLAAAERESEPLFWESSLRWRFSRRETQLSLATLAAISSGRGRVTAPLLDPRFVAALGAAGGALGAGNRIETLERFFGAALPDAIRQRRDKALFGEVFWRETSLAHARRLASAAAVDDHGLVDPVGLRAEWSGEQPDGRTALMLQHLWLEDAEGMPVSGRRL